MQDRECTGGVELIEMATSRFWQCPPKSARPSHSGNFIHFRTEQTDRWNTMDVMMVQAESCKPKPEQCRCKSLLGSLLVLEPTVNRITGFVFTKPVIKGCRCYLGAAARKGFKFVKLHNDLEECTGVKKLSVGNYASMCKTFKKKKCYGRGEITKHYPDI